MFKSIVNAIINSNSTAVKVVGYTAIAAIGIGADIIGTDAKKVEEAVETAKAKMAKAKEVTDTVTEITHDEDTVVEVVRDEDVVVEVIHNNEDTVEEVYEEDSFGKLEENEMFKAGMQAAINSFVLTCENAVKAKQDSKADVVLAMEEMARWQLRQIHYNLGKEEERIVVHDAAEALIAFRDFGPTGIEWM